MTPTEFLARPIGSLTLYELVGIGMVRDEIGKLVAQDGVANGGGSVIVAEVKTLKVPRPAVPKLPKAKPSSGAKTDGPGKGRKRCENCGQTCGGACKRCPHCMELFT